MLRSELKTLFRRRRTTALLLVLAGLPILITVALKIANTPPEPGHGPPFIDQVTNNGFFAALTGLAVVLPFFLPLAIAVVSGDTIAGEANSGTLRSLLLRPVSRTRLLVAKYVSTMAFAFAATITVAAVGLAAGSLLFGSGNVISLSGVELSLAEACARALLAAVVVALSMAGLAAIGLFVSTLTEQPVGAMAAIAGVAIVSQILDSISQLRAIHPALFTHYWQSFVDLLRVPVDYGDIGKGLLLQLAWVAIFGSAAWARFTSKDVLA